MGNLEKQNENFKATADKQMEAFKLNTVEIQNKIASMSTSHEVQSKEIVDLEQQLKASNEKVVKYKGDVTKLMEKISRKEDVIEELQKEKKEVDDDQSKKDQMEKKLKTYQDIILQKSGQISKLEDENQKLLKEKLENIPFMEEKKKSRLLE